MSASGLTSFLWASPMPLLDPGLCTTSKHAGGRSERRDRVRKDDAGAPVCAGWPHRPGSRREVQHRVYAAATDQRSGGRRQGGVGEASEPKRNIPTASLPRAGPVRGRRGGEELSALRSRVVPVRSTRRGGREHCGSCLGQRHKRLHL